MRESNWFGTPRGVKAGDPAAYAELEAVPAMLLEDGQPADGFGPSIRSDSRIVDD